MKKIEGEKKPDWQEVLKENLPEAILILYLNLSIFQNDVISSNMLFFPKILIALFESPFLFLFFKNLSRFSVYLITGRENKQTKNNILWFDWDDIGTVERLLFAFSTL